MNASQKTKVIIVVLVVVIVVIMVAFSVVVLIVVIIIIISSPLPLLPGMHLTMRLVVAYWLLYDQSSPHCSLNSFPAIGLDVVEVWMAKG